MDSNAIAGKTKTHQKPQVFLESITFNDDTSLFLEQNSIVVFTGANNSGKSQVLKDIERDLDASHQAPAIVIKSTKYSYHGKIDEEDFLNKRFFLNQQGNYQLYDSGSAFEKTTLQQWWQNRTFHNGLHLLFVKLLSTELRLKSSNALNRNDQPEKHPIFRLNESETTAQKLSDYFHQAFGVDLRFAPPILENICLVL